MTDRVAICCANPEAFVRAHRWALHNRLTSLLISGADLAMLPKLIDELGNFPIIAEQDLSGPITQQPCISTSALPDQPTLSSEKWPEKVALLLTSGSTGRPVLIAKSGEMIRGEVACLRNELAATISGAEFVITVPLAHMYGYMLGFWLPQLSGAGLSPQRIQFPQDLRVKCASARAPLWVVTTPVHLRAYCAAGGPFPNVAGILCATAPLDPDLARRASLLFGIAITEIYGSTETGAVACRRWDDSARDPVWQPLSGITIASDESGNAVCDAVHLGGPVTLSDQIKFVGSGFLITGRSSELVKVAGKRQSLAALNRILTSLPGVIDATYFDPASANTPQPIVTRLAAFVVLAPGCTAEQVMSALRQHIDEVFLPRPLYVVDSLPRLESGKLRNSDLATLLIRCRTRQAASEDEDAEFIR